MVAVVYLAAYRHVSNDPKDQIESFNFEYSVAEFAEDWRGVRRYGRRGHTAAKRTIHLSISPDDRPRLMPAEQNMEPATVSQWFIDRYGEDPDHLYARYMRFTMLAAVFQDYEKEIRDAGLAFKDGYSEDLLPMLLRLRVQPSAHDIARFDPVDVHRAIRTAAGRRARA